MRETEGVNEIPRHAVSRTARMASLPMGAAGRATLGLGKRLTGRPADEVKLEFQQRTAEQLFRVLGDLKGGAMKLGQALSVFEAAMPEALAAPYRDSLTRLQQDAPPLPAATVHKVLASQLGPQWIRARIALKPSHWLMRVPSRAQKCLPCQNVAAKRERAQGRRFGGQYTTRPRAKPFGIVPGPAWR